jgi:hypothetical protein
MSRIGIKIRFLFLRLFNADMRVIWNTTRSGVVEGVWKVGTVGTVGRREGKFSGD